MAASFLHFNHTLSLFGSGVLNAADAYRVQLLSAYTHDATATTHAGVMTGATEIATGFGYTQDTKELSSVAITADTSVSPHGGVFDADDVIWTASGGAIDAAYALISDLTAPNRPPVFALDLGGTLSAADGIPFQLRWNVGGILRFRWKSA